MFDDLIFQGLRGGNAKANIPPAAPTPLAEEEVAAFENLIGERLPDPYRGFLLKRGGVHIVQSCVRPIEARVDFGEVEHANILYGGRDDKPYDLWSNYDPSDEWGPPETIPIGANFFGDQFYLAIKGLNRGKVFFVPQDERRICLTADSFTDFLNRLEADKS